MLALAPRTGGCPRPPSDPKYPPCWKFFCPRFGLACISPLTHHLGLSSFCQTETCSYAFSLGLPWLQRNQDCVPSSISLLTLFSSPHPSFQPTVSACSVPCYAPGLSYALLFLWNSGGPPSLGAPPYITAPPYCTTSPDRRNPLLSVSPAPCSYFLEQMSGLTLYSVGLCVFSSL